MLEVLDVLEVLDAAAVRQWCRIAVDLVDAHRAEIDALNVFPVADSDTGHNLLATLRAAQAALDPEGAGGTGEAGQTGIDDRIDDRLDDGPVGPTAAQVLARLAAGAAAGALGNSGFIASQILRGLAQVADPAAPLDAQALAAGLDAGARCARAAVVEPVEGTILTVVRAAADAALARVRSPGGLGDAARAAAVAADAALQRTPAQLAPLAQAGVVDAGGRGLVLMLDALVRTVTGVPAPLTPVRPPLRSERRAPAGHRSEVQYELSADPAAMTLLRAALTAIGDSVAVLPTGEDSWKVHVHVDDVGAAIEAGMDVGRPRRIVITDLSPRDTENDSSVVVVDPGPGLAPLFEDAGARVVSADAVATTLTTTTGRTVLLVDTTGVGGTGVVGGTRGPGGPDGPGGPGVVEHGASRDLETAVAAARERGARVSVVPTRSPVQTLAAVAAHDPERSAEDDVVAMAEAAAATRWAHLTVAAQDALTAVGICRRGDVLGLIDGEVVVIGSALLAVALDVVDRLLAVGVELITVLVADHAPHRTGELIEAHVRGRSPLTDVSRYPGGASPYPVVLGAE